jgi:hypothetical protein
MKWPQRGFHPIVAMQATIRDFMNNAEKAAKPLREGIENFWCIGNFMSEATDSSAASAFICSASLL